MFEDRQEAERFLAALKRRLRLAYLIAFVVLALMAAHFGWSLADCRGGCNGLSLGFILLYPIVWVLLAWHVVRTRR